MPTYEYRCPNGHDFERFYKTISAAETELPCPECGASASRQLSGGAGLLFKGSGFYLTDYGKNAHRKPAPESKGGESKSDSKSESKTESSPAKSESKPGAAPKADKPASPKSKPKSE